MLRQLEGTKAEMALAVNAYNLKRAIKVLGVRHLMALMG
ncbi:ISPsy6 [Pseudomonas amygdali pv. lachrymans]|nr:ISPsy6 [Pseudomonas syringae pv. maculicola]KPC05525.1 ISPsy6 [Pseudomonas amygdali pv. lachrymans]